MNNKEPEWNADLQERVDAFNAELQPLLAKFELGLAAIAALTPDGRISAQPTLVSVRQAPQQEEQPTPTLSE